MIRNRKCRRRAHAASAKAGRWVRSLVGGRPRYALCGLIRTIGTLLSMQCVSFGGSRAEEEYTVDLSGPVTVYHQSGREFKGALGAVSEKEISVRAQVDAGEVIYTFSRDDVRALTFPGEIFWSTAAEMQTDNKPYEAIRLMRALFDQRSRYLGWMRGEDVMRFTRLIDAYMRADQPIEAIAVAGRLAPVVQIPRVKRQLEEAVLLGHFRLGLKADARDLAGKWLEETPRFPESATGWWVLAKLQFDSQQYDDSLWTALRPIVFSGQLPVPYLEHCYATAIASAIEIEDLREADFLREEMSRRGLEWPDVEDLAPYRDSYFPVDTGIQTGQ